MSNGSRRLLGLPIVILASTFAAPCAGATFSLRPGSDFTLSIAQPQRTRGGLSLENGRLWLGTPAPAARRFDWTSVRSDRAESLGAANVGDLTRNIHFQRFRLLGLNGSTPFPIAAFEAGSRNRFFGDRVEINADIFRYRYGGYRLTLPIARGFGSTAVLPSLGSSSRTTGAKLQAVLKLGGNDALALNASYTYGRRTSLLGYSAYRQRTQIRSYQIVPTYGHIVALPNGQTLSFDAAAIYRSSTRSIEGLLDYSPNVFLIGGAEPVVRKSDATRFDASITYRPNARLSVAAFVRNLTDVRPDRSAPLTTRNFVNPATVSAVLSEPRTFGLVLNTRL